MGNIMVRVTAMTLASCGGGSGGAALPTGTSLPDIGPVYDDPKIIALERFQDGDQLVLFSSTDGTQTYLGLVQGAKLATALGQQQGSDPREPAPACGNENFTAKVFGGKSDQNPSLTPLGFQSKG